MPKGRFKISGPYISRYEDMSYHCYRTFIKEHGRWREIGITFFGDNELKTEKELLTGIRQPLLLNGVIEIEVFNQAREMC